MVLSRRQFFRTATGALAFASSYSVLSRTGLAQGAPIRVANILDATGPLNIYSLKQIKAIAMAIDEINKAGGLLGRPLELIFYDAQSNIQFNSQYATQAFVRDKVDVLLSGGTSSAREVMRPIVQRFKNFLVFNAVYEGGVCDRRHMCSGLVPGQQVEPLVDYVVSERGLKKGYILAADYNYGQITSKWMQKFIRAKGGEDIAVEFFPLDATNFAPVISRIQAAKPDVVWSVLVGDAQMAFYRQYEATIGKKNTPLASTTYGLGRENAALTPDENDGVLIATSFIDALPTEAAKSFVERFQAFSGENDYVGEYADFAYRGTMLWAEAVKKANSADPDDVIAALGGVSIQGAGGLYTVDGQTNHVIMDVHIAQGNRTGSFGLLKSFSQRPPSDTQAVCDLVKNPNDTKQYEPEL